MFFKLKMAQLYVENLKFDSFANYVGKGQILNGSKIHYLSSFKIR